MKNLLLAIGITGAVLYLFVPVDSEWVPASDDVTVIQFWHGWCGEYADALQEVIAKFNQTHPKIHCNALFMPTGAGENMKFFVSVAGGVPPDVIVVDGTQVASWADLGVLRPLDDRMAKAGITEDDFWRPCWEQCRYHNKTWALSAAADANFSLVWNKQLFDEADLDAEKPPRTLEELEQYCEKLTKRDENGRLLQLGFLPTYGASLENAVLTWGWAFGGRFFDPETQAFTCDDPHIIEAVKWMQKMRDFYGGQTKLDAIQAGFGDAAQHPFYKNKIAMHVSYISETQNTAKFAPNLEYGITTLPVVHEGDTPASWIGGWTLAMPYGHRGHEDEAFELIRWFTSDPEGTTFVSQRMKLLPAYRKSPFFETDVPSDPILRAYFEILKNAQHARPVTPANSFYMNELRLAVGDAMRDLKTVEEALTEAKQRTTEYLKRIQERTKAMHSK